MEEDYLLILGRSERTINSAYSLISNTYPLVHDPKVLPVILTDIHSAILDAITALLILDRSKRKIPPYQNTPESKLNIFLTRSVSMYGFPPTLVNLISEVTDILEKHKKSPVEFSRQNKFYILSEEYKYEVISIDSVRKYLDDAKKFVIYIAEILKENERITKPFK